MSATSVKEKEGLGGEIRKFCDPSDKSLALFQGEERKIASYKAAGSMRQLNSSSSSEKIQSSWAFGWRDLTGDRPLSSAEQ